MSTRERLVHLLTEAAEIEHNLLCSYLYAAFSLKGDDALPLPAARATRRWQSEIVGVAIEEMGHLVLVNNLLVAIGGTPHFDRPNLPVPAGYHPAGFNIRLRPFSKETLEHFIFLERPADARHKDGAGYGSTGTRRIDTFGDLVPSTPDYETIGEFYDALRSAIVGLAEEAGRDAFIDGAISRQIGPEQARLPGLRLVGSLDDAVAALDTIVEQGEGSTSCKANCHFTRFSRIRTEWAAFETANPDFAPAWTVADDPVMRCPAHGVERVWITDPHAARQLDLGNAIYSLALTLLANAYASPDLKSGFVAASITLMHALSRVGGALARLPSGDASGVAAGLTFAVPRNLQGDLPESRAVSLVLERLVPIQEAATSMGMDEVSAMLKDAADRLRMEHSASCVVSGEPQRQLS